MLQIVSFISFKNFNYKKDFEDKGIKETKNVLP